MKRVRISRDHLDIAVLLALLTMLIGILVVQTRSLFLAPVFDSYLWWGDESWLMLEFRQQMLTGKFTHPYALGSSIHVDNGFLLSNMWLSAALYGGAALLGFPLVSTGRVVTFSLSIVLLLAVFYLLRKILRVETHWALFGVLTLLSTRIFFITSHSARYDVLSALQLLVGLAVLKRFLDGGTTTRSMSYFLLGLGLSATLLVSVHVPLLLSLPALLMVIRAGAFRRVGEWAVMLGGALLGCSMLVLLYYFLYGHWGMFGGANFTSHESNLLSIPLLRPFSRSVQIANLMQKGGHLLRFAPLLSLFTILAAVAIVSRWRSLERSQRAFISLLVAALVGWFALESAAPPSYTLYPAVLLVIILTIGLRSLKLRSGMHLAVPLVLALWFSRAALADGLDALLIGKTLNNAQTEIFSEAMEHLEQRRPRVLIQAPFVARAIESKRLVPMTASFIDYPERSRSTIATLRHNDVRYLLLVASPLNQQYMREVTPLRHAAESYGSVLYRRTMPASDIMRSYFSPDPGQPDTVTLYKLSQ